MTDKRFRFLLQICLTLGFLTLGSGQKGCGQTSQPDWGFVKFLIDKENYQLSLLNLNNYSTHSIAAADSLSFYRGWTLYNLKELQQSTDAFRKVSGTSPFYVRSGLFGSWNLAYQKDLKSARQWLSELNGTSTDELSLLHFETLGIQLLQRDLSGFQKLRPAVSATHYAWSDALTRLDTYAGELDTYKPKSLVVAGLLSTVVPGLGKIYVGQTGSGISTFLICGVLGAMTVENGIKAGWGHWSTLVFGSLFTLFYAGNIYGSIVSGKEVRDYYNEDLDQHILLDMHLPIREFYR